MILYAIGFICGMLFLATLVIGGSLFSEMRAKKKRKKFMKDVYKPVKHFNCKHKVSGGKHARKKSKDRK